MLKTIRTLTVIFMLLLSMQLFAQIPGFEQPVYLNAKGETPNEFVHSLFGQIGVPVKVDGEIEGVVHGIFEGSAKDVFNKFSTAFNVHVYFNRSVAYVYHTDDIDERLLSMSNSKAKALIRAVSQMNLTDSRNALYFVDSAGVEVVGNQRFVRKVEELALKLKVKTAITPQAKSAAKVTKKADADELIVKEFKLKYASVIDKSQTISGHKVTIPGVATMLGQFIDRNELPTAVVIADSTAIDTANGDEIEANKQNKTHRRRNNGNRFLARIMAHPQTNSVWIEDTAQRMAIYQSMITAMDQQPQMVEIEATIIDINNSRQRELGINWRALNGDNEFLLGNGSAQDLRLQPGQQITPSGEGGILSVVMGDRTQFIARMRALENVGAAKFVSKPHVITNSNVEAILGATTEFFVRLEGNEAVSLEEKSFGTVLRVTPRVFEDGARDGINLMIAIEDGQASGAQVDNIPEIERSVVGTNAMIKQGQSLLIGGLIRETTADNTTKVPVLGDIPALGRLFQSKGQRVTTTERLFLITPRIVGDNTHTNPDAPVLRGRMEDIVSSSDQRSERASDQIQLKADRATKSIKGPSAFKKPIDTMKKTVLAEGAVTENAEPTSINELLVIPSTVKPLAVVTTVSNSPEGQWRVRNIEEEHAGWQTVPR